MTNSFIIIDIETTGVDSKKDRILSFSALEVSNKEITNTHNFRTNIPCPKTHLSYKYLKEVGSYTEEEVYEKIRMLIKNKVVVGWGLFFEQSFFNKKKILLKNKKDLMLIFRNLLKLKRNPKLTDMCVKYRVVVDTPAHTSLGDCYRVYELLNLFWRKNVNNKRRI